MSPLGGVAEWSYQVTVRVAVSGIYQYTIAVNNCYCLSVSVTLHTADNYFLEFLGTDTAANCLAVVAFLKMLQLNMTALLFVLLCIQVPIGAFLAPKSFKTSNTVKMAIFEGNPIGKAIWDGVWKLPIMKPGLPGQSPTTFGDAALVLKSNILQLYGDEPSVDGAPVAVGEVEGLLEGSLFLGLRAYYEKVVTLQLLTSKCIPRLILPISSFLCRSVWWRLQASFWTKILHSYLRSYYSEAHIERQLQSI